MIVSCAAIAKRAVFALGIFASFTLAGCSTVLFVRTPERQTEAPAIYESSRPFWLFGLIGEPQEVYVSKICLGKDVDQIATEYTGGNVLNAVLTLGIYTPRTIKIWCQL